MSRAAAHILAAVLVLAAISKLRRPTATASEFAELGLAGHRTLAWLVPAAELICAVALVTAPAWGGIAAFALIAGFSVVLVGALRSGRVISCNCFGALSSKPISALTLARNAGLLVLAAVSMLTTA